MVVTADSSAHGVANNIASSLASQNGTAKPRLLVCTSPVTGHYTPILNIASHLIERGYKMTFLGGAEFEESITKIGARFQPVPSIMSPEIMAAREKVPPGPERVMFDMKEFFVEPTTDRHAALYKALEEMKAEDPAGEIVIVTESFFIATLPLYFGAPLPKGFNKRPKILNIHAAAYICKSEDAGPFGLAMPPDSSEEGKQRNIAAYHAILTGPWAPLLDYQDKLLAGLGAKDVPRDILPMDNWVLAHDLTLQMCPPSVEYPRGDFHPKVRFVGAVTPRPIKKDLVYPSWWEEVVNSGKTIIVVTQGTVAMEYEHLIMPTLQAFADRDDVMTVAILAQKGASLPADFKMPSNARVVDYFPYDAILQHASIFINNAGYGGFTHGIVNGVPMIMAGITEDKPEVANRGEYAGIGINLRAADPGPERIREAAEEILADGKYLANVRRIRDENAAMKAMDSVEKAVLEVAALG